MGDIEDFDRDVAQWHTYIEACGKQLAVSMTSDLPRERTRAFGMAVTNFERAKSVYEDLKGHDGTGTVQ